MKGRAPTSREVSAGHVVGPGALIVDLGGGSDNIQRVMKNTLIILCGEAFSGKTFLARKLATTFGARIGGRDAVWQAIKAVCALDEMSDEVDDTLWSGLWTIAVVGARNNLGAGRSLIFDDNCFFLRQRDELRTVADKVGARSVLIYVDASAELIKQRKEENKVTKERHDIDSGWLAEDRKTFERPSATEDFIRYSPETNYEDLVNQIEQKVR